MLSYSALDEASDAFATGLLELGMVQGDRIGIWSPNNIEWIITMYAAAKLGLVLVNVNPAYRVTELEYALNKVGCKALVLAHRFKSSDYPAMIRELAPEVNRCTAGELKALRLPQLEHLILIGESKADGFFLLFRSYRVGRRGAG